MAEGGRGLAMVAACTSRWGYADAHPGRTVWAEACWPVPVPAPGQDAPARTPPASSPGASASGSPLLASPRRLAPRPRPRRLSHAAYLAA